MIHSAKQPVKNYNPILSIICACRPSIEWTNTLFKLLRFVKFKDDTPALRADLTKTKTKTGINYLAI